MTLTYAELDDLMIKAGQTKVDRNVIKLAHFMGLLRDTKLNNIQAVEINPALMTTRLQCLEAIIAIDKLESPNERLEMKRTLVY